MSRRSSRVSVPLTPALLASLPLAGCEERPLCIERTEACWARNRRARFLVTQ